MSSLAAILCAGAGLSVNSGLEASLSNESVPCLNLRNEVINDI